MSTADNELIKLNGRLEVDFAARRGKNLNPTTIEPGKNGCVKVHAADLCHQLQVKEFAGKIAIGLPDLNTWSMLPGSLNPSTYRALEKNHIHTFGDLLSYSIGDIVKMKGVGPATLSALQDVLITNNLFYLLR